MLLVKQREFGCRCIAVLVLQWLCSHFSGAIIGGVACAIHSASHLRSYKILHERKQYFLEL